MLPENPKIRKSDISRSRNKTAVVSVLAYIFVGLLISIVSTSHSQALTVFLMTTLVLKSAIFIFGPFGYHLATSIAFALTPKQDFISDNLPALTPAEEVAYADTGEVKTSSSKDIWLSRVFACSLAYMIGALVFFQSMTTPETLWGYLYYHGRAPAFLSIIYGLGAIFLVLFLIIFASKMTKKMSKVINDNAKDTVLGPSDDNSANVAFLWLVLFSAVTLKPRLYALIAFGGIITSLHIINQKPIPQVAASEGEHFALPPTISDRAATHALLFFTFPIGLTILQVFFFLEAKILTMLTTAYLSALFIVPILSLLAVALRSTALLGASTVGLICQQSSPNTVQVQGQCQICGTGFDSRETQKCPLCKTEHHTECWQYAGGCATYGCREEHARKNLCVLCGKHHTPPLELSNSPNLLHFYSLNSRPPRAGAYCPECTEICLVGTSTLFNRAFLGAMFCLTLYPVFVAERPVKWIGTYLHGWLRFPFAPEYIIGGLWGGALVMSMISGTILYVTGAFDAGVKRLPSSASVDELTKKG